MEDLKEMIFEYTQNGKNINTIAKQFNMGRDRLTKLFKDNNVEFKKDRIKRELKELYDSAIPTYLNNKSIIETCKLFNISTKKAFSEHVKSKGIDVINYQNLKTYDFNIFNKIDTEEKAYWLGFLYADGYITNSKGNCRVSLCLKKDDYEHVLKFKNFLNIPNEITLKTNKMGDAYRITFRNKQIVSDLINLGCVPNKSLILKFPTSEQVPNNLIRHFMRGYFDGDGYLGLRTNNKFKIRGSILGTEEFVLEFLKVLSIDKNPKKCNNIFTFEFRYLELLKFCEFVYDDCTVYLERKYQIFKNSKTCPPKE